MVYGVDFIIWWGDCCGFLLLRMLENTIDACVYGIFYIIGNFADSFGIFCHIRLS